MFLLMLNEKIHKGLLELNHGISLPFSPELIMTFDMVSAK